LQPPAYNKNLFAYIGYQELVFL